MVRRIGTLTGERPITHACVRFTGPIGGEFDTPVGHNAAR
jgi:hypothetical protein